MVVFLQNDAGFLKWGPTPERLDELIESYKVGRDRERDVALLSPPPTPNQPNLTRVDPSDKTAIVETATNKDEGTSEM